MSSYTWGRPEVAPAIGGRRGESLLLAVAEWVPSALGAAS
jgi:hypothetical protein